jgi:hypothetical protein
MSTTIQFDFTLALIRRRSEAMAGQAPALSPGERIPRNKSRIAPPEPQVKNMETGKMPVLRFMERVKLCRGFGSSRTENFIQCRETAEFQFGGAA